VIVMLLPPKSTAQTLVVSGAVMNMWFQTAATAPLFKAERVTSAVVVLTMVVPCGLRA